MIRHRQCNDFRWRKPTAPHGTPIFFHGGASVSRRIYPRPPIVEAVIQLRFADEIPMSAFLDALGTRLGEQYPDRSKRQDLIELTTEVQKDALATSARKQPHVAFLRSNDGLRLVGCGDGVVSIHVLAPYPGWEAFVDQAREVVEAIPEQLRTAGLRGIAVRYIDRIVLPSKQLSFNEYLTIMPLRPSSMPPELAGFRFATHAVHPDDSTNVILTLASAGSEAEDRPALIYDLDTQRTGNPLCGLRDTMWVEIAEALHQQQRDIFEESITDRARELFQ